jgi:hypothetical protein
MNQDLTERITSSTDIEAAVMLLKDRREQILFAFAHTLFMDSKTVDELINELAEIEAALGSA